MERFNIKKAGAFIYKHSKLAFACVVIIALVITVIVGNKDGGMNTNASTRNQKFFTCIDIGYGMTLTDIAEQYMTEEYHSVSDYIDEVKSINNLTSDCITSGATLVVPYYAEPMD